MSIEISMCLAVWNTSHLLKRSVQTYLRQDIDPARWELIVIDDNSMDDVQEAIVPLQGKLNVSYMRLNHSYGMRGNTVSFNTAFSMSHGHILAETTPECMLPKDALRQLLEPHHINPRCFVALKTYNLTKDLQLQIDTVDWQDNIMAIAALPGWNDKWVQNNVNTTHFGTHQVCSIKKDVFYEMTKGLGFPLFGDYGSDDPWYCGTREKYRVKDITLPNSCMAVHQWHAPFSFWMARGHAPHLNRFSHSMSNYLADRSGHVPIGGTCEIWDKGNRNKMSAEEISGAKKQEADVLATGISTKCLV